MVEKGYWVVAYRYVADEEALKKYGQLAIPAIEAGGGKLIIRSAEPEAKESGLKERIVVTEFDTYERALDTYNSPAYQEALKALGTAAERDFRIVRGL